MGTSSSMLHARFTCLKTAGLRPHLLTIIRIIHRQAHRCCVGQRVLFIMPHCELELYDAVLAANWDAARLAAIAIIGNSFRNYLESNLQRTRRLGRRVSWIQEHTRGASADHVPCMSLPSLTACPCRRAKDFGFKRASHFDL